MPEELARRAEEIIRRETCTAPAKRRKRGADFASVVCGAENLLTNAVPGYAMADFRVMQPGPLPWTAADAVRAMTTVMQFARDMAPDLRLEPDMAAQLGVVAFAMAWEVLMNDKPLGAEIVIPAASLEGTVTATDQETCEQCAVDCRQVGALRACTTSCSEQSSCGPTSSGPLETRTVVPWTVVADADAQPTDAPSEPSEPPKTECDMDDESGLPFNVFQGVYGQFCDEAKREGSLRWSVDSRGNRIPLMRRHLHERTPPPDPDAYPDVRIHLEWAPNEDAAVECMTSCADAYYTLSQSPCMSSLPPPPFFFLSPMLLFSSLCLSSRLVVGVYAWSGTGVGTKEIMGNVYRRC